MSIFLFHIGKPANVFGQKNYILYSGSLWDEYHAMFPNWKKFSFSLETWHENSSNSSQPFLSDGRWATSNRHHLSCSKFFHFNWLFSFQLTLKLITTLHKSCLGLVKFAFLLLLLGVTEARPFNQILLSNYFNCLFVAIYHYFSFL